MKHRLPLLPFLIAGVLWAHPMGNFSVSHYSRIEPGDAGVKIRYVLDLAEIPTFELLQEWKLDASSPRAELERSALRQARAWSGKLRIAVDGRAVKAEVQRATAVLDNGAGGMPILRVTADLKVACAPGRLTYEDGNFPDRAGWKEVVTPGRADRSKELTGYPQDPLAAPPQDLRATWNWRSTAVPTVVPESPISSVPSVPAAPGPAAPGMVVRGDFLSRLLQQGEIGWGMMLLGMAVAFGLGAIHALSPGHGKTIVAAYLVGSRGTPKHAAFLGAMVTFTHTISVFFLGFVTLFLSRYVLPEKIYPVLGAVSGLSIVWIGTTLLFKRLHAAHPHEHEHGHGPGQHTHDVPQGDVSMGSLIALGASGGLVPCPSALVLLLSSVALGRVALGLTLLVAFSAGLAVVLMGIGMVVLYARHLLPDSKRTASSLAFRYLPVASAAVIVCAGVVMTALAVGS